MKKRPKIGNDMTKVFKGYSICIVIYFIVTILYYIYDTLFSESLHAADKPLELYVIKWVYGLIICLSMWRFQYKPSFYWGMLFMSSIGILLLYILVNLDLVFYGSPVEQFLLEVVAFFLIITLHSKFIKKYYKLKIELFYYLWIIVPIIITIVGYKMILA